MYGVPEIVLRCGDGTTKVEPSVGDGNCAIHSVVGECTQQGFFHKNASAFLRDAFGPTCATFRARLNDNVLFQELKEVLWLELLKPIAVTVAGFAMEAPAQHNESSIVWLEIMKDPTLEQACVNAALDDPDHEYLTSSIPQPKEKVSQGPFKGFP